MAINCSTRTLIKAIGIIHVPEQNIVKKIQYFKESTFVRINFIVILQ